MSIISSSFIDTNFYGSFDNGITYMPLKLTEMIVDDINREKGKNIENFEKILDRYKQYQIDFINADTETNIALIIEQSETEKIINKFKKQLIDELNKKYPNDEYKTDDIKIDFKFPKELEEKIENENEMHNTLIEVLESDINDAKLLLNAAQTYEQKMEILKNYKILDDEGRINIYEKE